MVDGTLLSDDAYNALIKADETVRAERDTALAKLDSEREAWDRQEVVLTQRAESIAHDHAKAVAERDEALARLASAERTLAVARGLLHRGCPHLCARGCPWERHVTPLADALRAHDSSGSGAAQQSNPPRVGAETGRLVGCEPTRTPAHEADKQSRDNASADDKTSPEPAGTTRCHGCFDPGCLGNAGTTPDPQALATLADIEKLREECVGRIQRARDLMLAEAVSETREEIAGACERAFARWRENDEAVQLELLGDELRKGGAK